MFLYFYWRDHELVGTKYTMPWLQMPRGNLTSGLLDPYRTSWCLMLPLKTVQTWKRRTNQETTAAGKHKTLTQCMINVGPASQTVNQRWSCIGSTFSRLPSSANRRICWVCIFDFGPALSRLWTDSPMTVLDQSSTLTHRRMFYLSVRLIRTAEDLVCGRRAYVYWLL